MTSSALGELTASAPATEKARTAPLGVLVPGPFTRERVAGLSVGERAALLLRRVGCERVIALGPHARKLGPRAAFVEAASELPEAERVLVVEGDVAFDRAFLERLVARGTAVTRLDDERSVLAGPTSVARAWLARQTGAPPAIEPFEADGNTAAWAPQGFLSHAATPADRKRATAIILRSTGKAVDGPLTRLFERRISQAITSVLLPLPVSPNLMTTVSLLIGLTGAGLLATTETWTRALGAALFVFATIVDGCDGEIARSKLLESSFGRVYDTAVDIVVNACVFLGIATGVWREFLGIPEVWNATILLVTGGLLAMTAVESVRRLLPSPPPGSGLARIQEWAERFATMEWCYLVLGLSLVGELPFFFWGAAIGANVFAVLYFVVGVLAWLRA